MNYISHQNVRVKRNPRKLTGGNIGSPDDGRGVCFGEDFDGGRRRLGIITWNQTRDRSTTNEQEKEPGNMNGKPLQGGER
jgi:hypothetical protein